MTPFDLAQRYVGLREIAGAADNPLIVAMLKLASSDGSNVNATASGWPSNDETSWCSAFVSWVAWHFAVKIPSKALRARSWLTVGMDIPRLHAHRGWDVVVLKRGGGAQPGPEVLDAQGHVGFFHSFDPIARTVRVLGGNQSDAVNVATFPADRILGVRRLQSEVPV